jgi:hypothetical protein
MTPHELKDIRRRARQQPTLGLVAQHSQAVADRQALLEYIDAVDAEVKKLGDSVTSTLAASRILLGIKILEDGHAPNLGRAIDIASDMVQVRALYPDVDE